MKSRLLLAAVIAGSIAYASSPSFWEMTSFTDFIAGTMNGVALSRDGRLSPAPQLTTVFDSGQPVIWSVVPGPNNSLFVATGHRGRVYRVDSNGTSSLLWTADKPEVFALAATPDGDVYAASSPNGKIYKIHNGQATEYFDPKAHYIWALAVGRDGALYAGTGDEGNVYRITGAAQGELYYATGQGNVTGLMVDPQGRVLAGTEPNGILYRITAKDKAFTLYDSTLPELRAVASMPDGTIYAAGLGGALAKRIQATQQNQAQPADTTPTISTTITVTGTQAGPELKPTPTDTRPAAQPQQVPQPATPAVTEATGVEKSAIYRINPDNTVDTLWSSKEENVYDILPRPNGEIDFVTDENGRIYQLTADRKLTLVAQTNDAEAVRILSLNNALLVATANAGKLYKLGPAGTKGSYESPVFDASGVARWGHTRWSGEGISIQTRSGNSLRPDPTWSDWSTPLSDANGSQVPSPNARYLQYRAEFTGASAHLDNVSTGYLPYNNPPAIHTITVTQQAPPAPQVKTTAAIGASPSYSITVTDTGDTTPNVSTGTATQTLSRAIIQQILIAWAADDPDADKLVFEISYRGEGENQWKILRRDYHDTSLAIDGDSLADGRYFFKVVASDRESNPASTAKQAELISSPVLIDNTPPAIHVASSTRNSATADIAFDAQDTASPLRRAEYSLDAGTWLPISPVDGILDSRTEQFRLHLDNIPTGEHTLVLRVADSAGNTGLAKVILH